MKKKMQKKTRIDEDRPIGKLTRVRDFLPPPEELLPKENVIKVTLTLDADTVHFFKKAADDNGNKYQRMMRTVLRNYAEKYEESA